MARVRAALLGSILWGFGLAPVASFLWVACATGPKEGTPQNAPLENRRLEDVWSVWNAESPGRGVEFSAARVEAAAPARLLPGVQWAGSREIRLYGVHAVVRAGPSVWRLQSGRGLFDPAQARVQMGPGVRILRDQDHAAESEVRIELRSGEVRARRGAAWVVVE